MDVSSSGDFDVSVGRLYRSVPDVGVPVASARSDVFAGRQQNWLQHLGHELSSPAGECCLLAAGYNDLGLDHDDLDLGPRCGADVELCDAASPPSHRHLLAKSREVSFDIPFVEKRLVCAPCLDHVVTCLMYP